jgi:hypothetical protein
MDVAYKFWERLNYYYSFGFCTLHTNFIGSQEKSIGESLRAIEAWLDGSREAHECVSFDFEKCSLDNLRNDYPKLFQFDHEQRLYILFDIVHFIISFLEREMVPAEEVYIMPKLFIPCIIIFVVKPPILFAIKDNWQKLIMQLVIEFCWWSLLIPSIFVLVIEYDDGAWFNNISRDTNKSEIVAN